MEPKQEHGNLAWIDLEMSGLEPETDQILEIATIVTDSELNVLEEGPNLVLFQPDSVLDAMDEWNQEHHGQSGLIGKVRQSKITLQQAEILTLDFLKKWGQERSMPLCGNSIGQDRRFLYKYMPVLSEWLHYRSVDVSSFKEMARRWYPDLPEYEKSDKHEALADIRESIGELAWYRQKIMVNTPR